MELTQIDLMGVRVLEPVTSLTDLITATVSYYAFFRLRQLRRPEPVHHYFKAYFLLMGISMTFAGLIGHAFLYLVDESWKAIGWTFSALSIAMLGWGAALALRPVLGERWITGIRIWLILQFLIFMASILNPDTRSFDNVKINSAVGMVGIVLPLTWYAWRRSPLRGRWIKMAGIVLGLLPSITYNLEISLHKWFNYHDISHVLMATCMYVIYLGARSLAETGPDCVLQPPQPEVSHA
ncbi:MAG: hypothetical protein NW241_21750 [Bacteroidia bacterium]|nr:hypothetical protein [Bacteroidia bacterium]